jgi:nuclear protein localization family protein 4
MASFEQRIGFLYGYYCEDHDYEGGIRAVVEAVYEPPQRGDYRECLLLADPNEGNIEKMAEALGLERVGWIFTSRGGGSVVSPGQMVMAAQFQNKWLATHACGYKVPKFLSVVCHCDGVTGNIGPQVFMVSDHFGAMVRDGILEDCQTDDAMLRFKDSQTPGNVYPSVLREGKNVGEVEPEFFLVSVASGQPHMVLYSVIKNHIFPVENRGSKIPKTDLKTYMRVFKKNGLKCYADFHLLVYLVTETSISMREVLKLAEAVDQEKIEEKQLKDLERKIEKFASSRN